MEGYVHEPHPGVVIVGQYGYCVAYNLGTSAHFLYAVAQYSPSQAQSVGLVTNYPAK